MTPDQRNNLRLLAERPTPWVPIGPETILNLLDQVDWYEKALEIIQVECDSSVCDQAERMDQMQKLARAALEEGKK